MVVPSLHCFDNHKNFIGCALSTEQGRVQMEGNTLLFSKAHEASITHQI
jgi:hypothetical protein